MNISVVGTGYVGLVTGTCFAEMGHKVVCVDIDAEKIQNLNSGILPIYEPGLQELVDKNVAEGRLSFTVSLAEAVRESTIHFIAVGTPPGEDGSADLKYVLNVAEELGRSIVQPTNVIVNKSTVPIGTAEKVHEVIAAQMALTGTQTNFSVVSNPEFLKEGSAIDDFMRPDRVIIGTDSEDAGKTIYELYAPFMRNHEVILQMGLREAELTKYTANALLATKISFMNEIAALCEKLDVDVESVRLGIGSDNRIGYHFIYPGCGYGGSCFPKDVKALIHIAKANGHDPLLLTAVETRNERQKSRLSEKIFARFGRDLRGKTFAIWGLSFKPGTDDMREAPSLVLIKELIDAGAAIQAHDPIAIDAAKKELTEAWLENKDISFVTDQYQTLDGADSLVLVTEWKPFKNPDFEQIKDRLKFPLIFDGRNQFDPDLMKETGIEYRAIGRGLQE